ncbi:hypothetical protein F2Q70_00020680 [Brassica cretica]|uniref:Uncharacterized protein n=1 Tax=Brassica cretica TaxID=69181 RepID=A0A8S9GPZ1_BRACR|nr:hypothetical protein F2Q70_00020680 [Brassica cretica]
MAETNKGKKVATAPEAFNKEAIAKLMKKSEANKADEKKEREARAQAKAKEITGEYRKV